MPLYIKDPDVAEMAEALETYLRALEDGSGEAGVEERAGGGGQAAAPVGASARRCREGTANRTR